MHTAVGCDSIEVLAHMFKYVCKLLKFGHFLGRGNPSKVQARPCLQRGAGACMRVTWKQGCATI